MSIVLLIAIVFIIAAINIIMVPIQARNGQILGVYWATAVYLVVGTVASLVLMIVRQETSLIQNIKQIPYYVYLNGLFNVLIAIGFVTLVPKAGIGLTWASTTFGQFSAALIFDHFGVLGLSVAPMNIQKLIGAILIMSGSFLFARKKKIAVNRLGMSEGVQTPSSSSVKQWSNWSAIGLGIAIGGSQTMMSIINARSGQIIGVTGAVALYLGLGAVLSLIIVLIYQPKAAMLSVRLPFYYYTPGIANVLLVGLPAVLIPMVGVGIYTAVSFLASALASMLFDSIGAFGMSKIPVNVFRVAGVVIMLFGVLLLKLAQS
jgi:bacterial/archaeal transporter family-2 protein